MSKKIAFVGRLAADVRVATGPKGEFLSFRVITDRYNSETKSSEAVGVDCTLNRYGAGLVAKLVKGTQVAVVGLSGTREHNGKTYETLMVDELSIGAPLMHTFEKDGKTFALVVGRLGKDAREATSGEKTFLSMSVAAESYNKESKTNDTVWLDATLNRYGAGLVPRLTKGTGVALVGVCAEKQETDGTLRKKLYIDELNFFGNKKETADAADAADAI